MQLTEAQVKQAIGDLYLDNWRMAQVQAALVGRVRELEKELEAAKAPVAPAEAVASEAE